MFMNVVLMSLRICDVSGIDLLQERGAPCDNSLPHWSSMQQNNNYYNGAYIVADMRCFRK
eukprot:11780870-Karenia_brevis.AAC.1